MIRKLKDFDLLLSLLGRREMDPAIGLEVGAKIGTIAAAEEEGSLWVMAVTRLRLLRVLLLGVLRLLLGLRLRRAGGRRPSD